MLLVGGGALLERAVAFSRRAGLNVDAVCCPPGDYCTRLAKTGVSVLESNDPDTDLFELMEVCSDGIVFSINNRHILGDRLLGSGLSFFNIHNGLTQQYRGIAEVCVFAAICNGSRQYGATLHGLLPGQKVDAGPVVAQLQFDISDGAAFSDVMSRSINLCEKMFEFNAPKICAGTYSSSIVQASERAYAYKDVPRICSEADATRLERACDLRQYAAQFPKLKALIESVSLTGSDRAGNSLV